MLSKALPIVALVVLLTGSPLLLNAEAQSSDVCSDHLDNDNDGLVDAIDPGCVSNSDPDETNAGQTCVINIWQVGVVNQGLVDQLPTSPQDIETPEQWLGGESYSEVINVNPFQGALSVGVLGYAPLSQLTDNNRPQLDVAKTINYNFEVSNEISYPEFVIGRYGSEENQVSLDGVILGSSSGSENQWMRSLFTASALQPGQHTLSISYVESGANNGNYLDFVALNGCVARPACSDGWDNDGDGLADMMDAGCSSVDQTSEVGEDEFPGAVKVFQLGRFDAFKSPKANPVLEYLRGDTWVPEINYTITESGTTQPLIAGYLSNIPLSQAQYPDGSYLIEDGRPLVVGAKVLNLKFSLATDVNDAQIRLLRMGDETNTFTLDGTVVSETAAGSGQMMAFIIDLGDLKIGDHILAIQYNEGGQNNGNYMDALGLIGYPQAPTVITPSGNECPEGKPSDLCGVCGGNNSTCRSCSSINTSSLQEQSQNLGGLQLSLARRAYQRIRSLSRTSKKASARSLYRNSQRVLTKLSPRYPENVVNLDLSYPEIITTSCSITQGCTLASLSTPVDQLINQVTNYYNLGVIGVNQVKKLGLKVTPNSNDGRRLERMQSTQKDFLSTTSMLPAQSLVCGQ